MKLNDTNKCEQSLVQMDGHRQQVKFSLVITRKRAEISETFRHADTENRKTDSKTGETKKGPVHQSTSNTHADRARVVFVCTS